MSRVRLTLYVAGSTPRTDAAIDNLRRICQVELAGEAEFTVVDVVEHPERAEEARILTTPTVIREAPPPIRRVTGDLSGTRQVVAALGLQPGPLTREQP